MTSNNYPEGLDELAEELDAKFKPQWASDAARALLDALAERGYVLVDAKKQEPDAEHEYAIKEGARISACEGYFNARPEIDCLDRRRVFEAGFDHGYDDAMQGKEIGK